jgi:ParB family chromosome partitioning protein
MSTSRSQWIGKRGQIDADAAIGQVLDRQPGEQIQHLPDAQIADSPYQARRPFSDASVEDLAQSMRTMGFQGVLIVRPHGNLDRQRAGFYQLVYGHRRRAAWQRVCAERNERCLLPVIVREVSDERMLTIGAQENLQREDLDPIEEAQIVDWHQRMFSDKNQGEIGAMLGKSSDWVSVRARISKLPDALKERLRQRPRAISQMLELGVLAMQQPDLALQLADRVVGENLTLESIRTLIRGYIRPERNVGSDREQLHNRRGTATSVQEITNDISPVPVMGDAADEPATQPLIPDPPVRDRAAHARARSPLARGEQGKLEQSVACNDADATPSDSLSLLRNAATALTAIATYATDLPISASTTLALDQAERAVSQTRSVLMRTAIAQIKITSTLYQLVDTDLHDILVLLLGHRPIRITLRSGQRPSPAMQVVMFIMPDSDATRKMPHAPPGDLFMAVGGAGHGVVPLIVGIPMERVRNSLGLAQESAATIAALINDLAGVQAGLQ